jgi:hypothetical protein
LKEERQKKGGKYDCIIGASGGLDSSYVIYIAKEIMDLKPLVVSYVNDFSKRLARENLKQICKELNIDLKIITSNKKFDKKHIRSFVRALNDVGSYWGCCVFCGYILDAVIYKFASEENISTMLGSSNLYESVATEYLTKEFKKSFMRKNVYKTGFARFLKFLFHMSIAQYYFIRFKMEFSASSRVKTFFQRSTLCSIAPGKPFDMSRNIKEVDVTKYIHWDVDKIVMTLENELGWKSPEKPELPMRFDCVLEDALIDRTYKNATGVTFRTLICNNLIYAGLRTKKELEDTVKKYEDNVASENIQLLNNLEIN